MRIRAEFNQKTCEIYTKECEIEKVIKLSQKEYQSFAQNMLQYFDFMKENENIMYVKDGIWHCLLVMGEESEDGVLVQSEGAGYARYSAYLPSAAVLLERRQVNTALKELEKVLSEAADAIVQEGIRETGDGEYTALLEEVLEQTGLGDYLRGQLAGILKERQEVKEVFVTCGGIDVSYDKDYCQSPDEGKDEYEEGYVSMEPGRGIEQIL